MCFLTLPSFEGRLGPWPQESVIRRLGSEISTDLELACAWITFNNRYRACLLVQSCNKQMIRRSTFPIYPLNGKPNNDRTWRWFFSYCLTWSVGKTEGKWKLLRQHFVRRWKQRGKIFHMALAYSAWQRKLWFVVRFLQLNVSKGEKPLLSERPLSSNRCTSPPSSPAHTIPSPLCPPLFTHVGAGKENGEEVHILSSASCVSLHSCHLVSGFTPVGCCRVILVITRIAMEATGPQWTQQSS